MHQNRNHDDNPTPRLVAKVLRDVLAGESYATYADVADALKCRLARLRIPWSTPDITAALGMVESNRPLISRSPSSPFHEPSTTGDARTPPVSHAYAVDILDRVRARHIVNGWSTR